MDPNLSRQSFFCHRSIFWPKYQSMIVFHEIIVNVLCLPLWAPLWGADTGANLTGGIGGGRPPIIFDFWPFLAILEIFGDFLFSLPPPNIFDIGGHAPPQSRFLRYPYFIKLHIVENIISIIISIYYILIDFESIENEVNIYLNKRNPKFLCNIHIPKLVVSVNLKFSTKNALRYSELFNSKGVGWVWVEPKSSLPINSSPEQWLECCPTFFFKHE